MTIQSNLTDTIFFFDCCSDFYGLSQYFNNHPDYSMFLFGDSDQVRVITNTKPAYTAVFVDSDIILHDLDLYKKWMVYSDIFSFYDTWKYNLDYLNEYNTFITPKNILKSNNQGIYVYYRPILKVYEDYIAKYLFFSCDNILGIDRTWLTKLFMWCKSLDLLWLDNFLDFLFGKQLYNFDHGQGLIYRRDFNLTWSAYVYDNAFFRKYKVEIYLNTAILPHRRLMPIGISWYNPIINYYLPCIGDITHIGLDLKLSDNLSKTFALILSNLNLIYPWFFGVEEVEYIYYNRQNLFWMSLYTIIFYISVLSIACFMLFVSHIIVMAISKFNLVLYDYLIVIFKKLVKVVINIIVKIDHYITNKYMFTRVHYLYIKKNYSTRDLAKASIKVWWGKIKSRFIKNNRHHLIMFMMMMMIWQFVL